MNLKLHKPKKITGRSYHTVLDWFNLCRDLITGQFKKFGKGLIVQLDESIFQGKCKYRGRLCLEDCKPVDKKDTDDLPILPRIILTKIIKTTILIEITAKSRTLRI